jgi:parvulin-like peptidyl-prolyl isomerase
LRQATDGVYNVKTSKPIQAMVDKMPPEMRKALEQAGTKRLIGPMPSQEGVRLIAFCGKKTMAPPKPTREMVENMVLNEKYSSQVESTIRELRRKSFVDYKDASLQSQ